MNPLRTLLGLMLHYARPTSLSFAIIVLATADAQLLTNNGAVITGSAGSDITVLGTVQNQGATGVLDINGTLSLTGDFIHDAPNSAFGSSSGTVVLNGGVQAITGLGNAIFNSLTLAGTGDKTLMRATEVGGNYIGSAGTLDLNDRRLMLNGNTLTVRNSASNAIERTTGFVVSETDALSGYGTLRWNIGAAGSAGAQYEYPFGSAAISHYLPVRLTFSSAGGGIGGYVSLSTYPTDPNPSPNNRPLPTGLPSLTDMAGLENAHNVLDRWWVMATGGYLTAPVADIRFSYRDSEWNSGSNLIAEPTLMLQDFWNGQWQYPPSVADAVSNTLTTIGRTLRNGPWTASTIGSPLPMELIAFQAKRSSDALVSLEWTTATELNNAGFEVWRMIEGEDDFKEVGWVDGRGTTQQLSRYTLNDANATDRVSYYKLKQVDYDGTPSWSDAVAVEGARASARLIAYPNPARDNVRLSGLPEDAEAISMNDSSGRLVKQWPATQSLDGLAHLERGVYTIAVQRNNHAPQTLKIVLE